MREGASGGRQSPNRPEKERQRKKERKYNILLWLVLAQLLMLVCPALYILLVFLRPLLSSGTFHGGLERRGGTKWG